MTADLRGFAYALAPILDRGRWQLDALQVKLGRLQREIDAIRERRDGLQDQHRFLSSQSAQRLDMPLDPVVHSTTLQWLVQLNRQIDSLGLQLNELRSRHSALMRECLAQNQKVQAIEAHRDEAMHDYTREESARLANESDRDWLARRAGAPTILQSIDGSAAA
jgi:predicted  nucleic acid-binding Zn-ribbon protein